MREVRGGGSLRGRPALRRRRRGLVILLLLLTIALAAYRLYSELSGPEETAVPVRRGTLELTVVADAVVVRREQVHAAPVAGTVLPYAAEGRHVRVGTPVAAIRPAAGEPVVMPAQSPGAVSYRLDGLEEALRPESLAWLLGSASGGPGPDWLEALPGSAVALGGSLPAGAAAFKIVDPAQIWLVFPGPVEATLGVHTGEDHRVEFPTLGRDAIFHLRYISAPVRERRLLGLEADGPFPEETLLLRRLPVRVVVERWTGLIVPLAALNTEGGRIGVWIRDPYGGGRQHVVVTVLGRTAEGAVIEGDLDENDLVLVPVSK